MAHSLRIIQKQNIEVQTDYVGNPLSFDWRGKRHTIVQFEFIKGPIYPFHPSYKVQDVYQCLTEDDRTYEIVNTDNGWILEALVLKRKQKQWSYQL